MILLSSITGKSPLVVQGSHRIHFLEKPLETWAMWGERNLCGAGEF